MKTIKLLATALALALGSLALAQLLPSVPRVDGVLGGVTGVVRPALDTATQTTQQLADARLDRIARLVHANPDRIALDPQGFPARAHEVVLTDPAVPLLAATAAAGFGEIEHSETLGIAYVRLSLPPRLSLKNAIALLRRLGATDVSADQLYSTSGSAPPSAAPLRSGNGARIGIIDGGVLGNGVTQRGFASGAPRPSAHGTAIASLIVGAGPVRGAAPDAQILAADVYGSDPAGGNATALVKALGWLVGERTPVVTISLVGPPNPLLARVIAAAQARGTVIVAAVGNDGAASPPSYPASYPGVIAVTATDGRKRILIEAGRATHLDYAAPGADMLAADGKGGSGAVRGTSFAAPLVAATILGAYPVPDAGGVARALTRVDGSAEKLGSKYGRGLVCGGCRTAK